MVKKYRLSERDNDLRSRLIEEQDDYAIFTLDLDGNIMNWNPGAEKIKGYLPEDIILKNFRLFYTQNDLENQVPDSLLNQAKSEGKVYNEGWRLRKNGSQFWAGVTITAIHDDNDEVIGFGKITRDLTSIKVQEEMRQEYLENLQDKNQELQQLTKIASHDLQEPIRNLNSFLDLIHHEFGTELNPDLTVYLNYISGSAKRMEDLVKGLFVFSQLGIEKERKKVSVKDLFEDVKMDLFSAITDSGVELSCTEMPTLSVYEVDFRQLLQNLLSNAFKFRRTVGTPKVELSCSRDGENHVFCLKDNGIGIHPEHHKEIFLLFKRLHAKNKYEGLGLGLANCKKIVELHGGRIWVDSVPGEGSSFYFTIPG